MKQDWQEQMDVAFDLYLTMSPALQDDVEAILKAEDGTQSYRRNFIRAACSLVEGYVHCFREIARIGLATGPGDLTSDEVVALSDERSLGSADRTRLTLRAAFKMLQLPEPPEFGNTGWANARCLLSKRDLLMHPKSAEDLAVPDALWDEIYAGTSWLFAKLFGFMEQLALKHGT